MEIQKEIEMKINYRIVKAPTPLFTDDFDEKKRCQFIREASIKQLEDMNMKVYEGHNIVPNVLRNSLALLISGTTVTPTFKANYCALGSDSTPPTNANTQLGTETKRGLFTNRYAIDNVAYLDKFRGTAEVNGFTFLEVGTFVDGTVAINSGFLLSRININETMGPNETLTINVSITIV